jgi:hypothetical protein
VSVARAQDMLTKASVINVESQLTTVGIDMLLSDGDGSSSDDSEGHGGDNSEDSERICDAAGGYKEVGGGAASSVALPPFHRSDDKDGRWGDELIGKMIILTISETNYTANQYDVHERTSHFKERRPITDKNRVAVEAIYMIEALTLVKRMKRMRKPEVAQHLQERCKGFICSIPLTRFSDASIKVKMEEMYFRAKGTSTDGLLTKANEVLKNVPVLAAGIRGVSTPLHQIPSGKNLTDLRNEFILKK